MRSAGASDIASGPRLSGSTQKRTPGLIGFANDGCAGVPGALRVYVTSDDGKVMAGGSLDAGYPLPGKIRQAQFVLPRGVSWKGLKLRQKLR